MKRKIVRVLLTLILVIALTISASCSTKLQSIEFVPDFSQDRMIETIRVLSAEDGGRIAGFEGEADIAEYISDQFESIGLEISEQIFPVKAFACEKASLNLVIS